MKPGFLAYASVAVSVALLVIAAAAWLTQPSSIAPYRAEIDGPRVATELQAAAEETGRRRQAELPTVSENTAKVAIVDVPATDEDSSINPLERLNRLLADERYQDAVELFGDEYSQLSDAESVRYRSTILSVARQLAEKNRHQDAVELLQQYTHLFFKDLEALNLLADNLHLLKNYTDEIEVIMLALNEAYLEPDIHEFNRKLDGAIAAQDLLFVQQNDPEGAVEFRRSLSLTRPESIPYQLGLARALVNAGEIDEAASLLEALPEHTEFEGQIDRLKQMADASRPVQIEETAIPLGRVGNGFVVEAVLNGGQSVRLLVDTGATLTIIRPGALGRAGIGPSDFIDQTILETAGGRVGTAMYGIDSLRLGPEVVTNVKIGSVDIPGLGSIDGLLGMNVLSRFKFAIDHTRQVMVLTR